MRMSTKQSGSFGAVELLAGMVMSGLVAAFTFPLVFDQIEAVDTTYMTSGTAALWDIFPTMMVLVVFLGIVGTALYYS